MNTGLADMKTTITSESSKLEGKIKEETSSIIQNVTTEFNNSKRISTLSLFPYISKHYVFKSYLKCPGIYIVFLSTYTFIMRLVP